MSDSYHMKYKWPYRIERSPIHAPCPLNHHEASVVPGRKGPGSTVPAPTLTSESEVFREESFWIATGLPWALGQVSLSLCVLACQMSLGIAHSRAVWQGTLRLMSSSRKCPRHSQVLQMADTVVTCVALGFPEAEPRTKGAFVMYLKEVLRRKDRGGRGARGKNKDSYKGRERACTVSEETEQPSTDPSPTHCKSVTR